MHPLDEVRLGMARLNFHLVHEHPEPLFMGELPRSYDTVPAPVVINMCGVFAHPEPPVRFTFGMPLLDNQVVHFRLAELQSEVELLRALIYTGGEEYVNGKDVLQKASIAKLKAGRLTREVYDSCLQYWGGQGFMWDSNIARGYRDSRLGSIGGGADEVMLSIICKTMDILPGKKKG